MAFCEGCGATGIRPGRTLCTVCEQAEVEAEQEEGDEDE